MSLGPRSFEPHLRSAITLRVLIRIPIRLAKNNGWSISSLAKSTRAVPLFLLVPDGKNTKRQYIHFSDMRGRIRPTVVDPNTDLSLAILTALSMSSVQNYQHPVYINLNKDLPWISSELNVNR